MLYEISPTFHKTIYQPLQTRPSSSSESDESLSSLSEGGRMVALQFLHPWSRGLVSHPVLPKEDAIPPCTELPAPFPLVLKALGTRAVEAAHSIFTEIFSCFGH